MNSLRVATIYKWKCKDSYDVFYIGSAWDFDVRKGKYKYDCKTYPDQLKHIICNENGGFDNFTFEVLEEYECYDDEERFIREQEYIDRENPCMNCNRAYRSDEERDKYNKQYYKENKEEILENQKQYYQENKQKILEYQKQYNQENKEKKREYQKQYNQENKEKKREQDTKYRQENKEEINEKAKEKIPCPKCEKNIRRGNMSRHLKVCSK